jgi:hypothetical protein
LWKGFYAAGSYVFASQGVNNVNAISVYSLAAGTFEGKFTPVGVSPTGLNDEDNPINVRVLADGTYAVFSENDLTNNLTFYRWSPPNAGDFTTTNVLDTNAHTLLQGTSTLTANQTSQTAFASAVSTAYSSGFGGVIQFNTSGEMLTSAPAIVAQYGSKTLTIGLTTSSTLAISPLQPSSGPTGVTNCLSAPNAAPNLGDETFTMGAITRRRGRRESDAVLVHLPDPDGAQRLERKRGGHVLRRHHLVDLDADHQPQHQQPGRRHLLRLRRPQRPVHHPSRAHLQHHARQHDEHRRRRVHHLGSLIQW